MSLLNGRSPQGYAHKRTAREVLRCKKGHRSDLKASEWGKYGYAHNDEVLMRPIEYDGIRTLPIARIKRSDITVEDFFLQYALPGRPCIIEGCMDSWPAMERWSLSNLQQSLRHALLKVGEDDKGRKLRMKYKYFADYMEHQHDDSPLYLFESKVENEAYARRLLEEFKVPDIFPHDLFELVNVHSKPPYRWWSLGPKRSGTTVHVDPLGTSAWNAVTHGRKRWVLFEPHVSGQVAKGKDVINKETEDDEAIMYFDFLLPRLKAKHPEIRTFEGIQGPGEVIFVPGDWWHGVINLEDTVAVTQNYCGLDNFERVWVRARKERKKLAYLWFRNMEKFAPTLFARARELNQQDGFLMRHERGPGAADSDSSSSSSESSSDSSMDEQEDLDLSRVNVETGIQPPWLSGLARPQELRPPLPAPPVMPSPPTTAAPAGVRSRVCSASTSAKLASNLAEGCGGTATSLQRKRPYAPTELQEEMRVQSCT